jgi:hypothetical protein
MTASLNKFHKETVVRLTPTNSVGKQFANTFRPLSANSPQTNIRCFLFPVGKGKQDTLFASVDVFPNTSSVYRELPSWQELRMWTSESTRFEVFTAMRMMMMMMFFCVLAPCRLVGRFQRFGETYCLHLQGCWHLPTSLRGAKTQNNIMKEK